MFFLCKAGLCLRIHRVGNNTATLRFFDSSLGRYISPIPHLLNMGIVILPGVDSRIEYNIELKLWIDLELLPFIGEGDNLFALLLDLPAPCCFVSVDLLGVLELPGRADVDPSHHFRLCTH